MLINDSFMKTQFLLGKAMSAETLRHTVITNNIANADTPYFKRSDVTFESELKKALDNKNPYPFEAKKTHPKHFGFHQPKDFMLVEPKIHLEFETVYRNDKNNVDIDKEMVEASKSAMRFNAFTSMMSRNFKKMNMLMRG